jgi:hypothetical protein
LQELPVADDGTRGPRSSLLPDLEFACEGLHLYPDQAPENERTVFGAIDGGRRVRIQALPGGQMHAVLAVEIANAELAVQQLDDCVKVGHVSVRDLNLIQRVPTEANRELRDDPFAAYAGTLCVIPDTKSYCHGNED